MLSKKMEKYSMKRLKASSEHKLEKRQHHKSINSAIKNRNKMVDEELKKHPSERRTMARLKKEDYPLPKKRKITKNIQT